MRKVKVACTVNYTYEAELPDDVDINANDGEDVLIAVDGQDPVYKVLAKVIYESKIGEPIGQIDWVQDKDTGEYLFMI